MTNSVEIKAQDAAASVETSYTISVNSGFEGVLAGMMTYWSAPPLLFADTEAGKNLAEQVVRGVLSRYHAQGLLQPGEVVGK